MHGAYFFTFALRLHAPAKQQTYVILLSSGPFALSKREYNLSMTVYAHTVIFYIL